MASSNRIIGAEDLTEVRLFKLDELRGELGAAGHAPRHRKREDEGPPPGYKEGFRRGLEEGIRRGAQAASEKFNREQAARMQAIAEDFGARAEALHGSMDAALAEVRETLAGQAIELALEIARQVIRSRLREDPTLLEPVVREAIASLVDERAGFVLHLSPDDADLLGPNLDPVLQARGARLVRDPAIQAGGCRITSPDAEVDATLATRWQRVLAAIGHPPAPLEPADAP